MIRTPIETDAAFNARIAAEEQEARAVACPLESCEAMAGEPCCTQAGEPRIRHARRLMLARKAENRRRSADV